MSLPILAYGLLGVEIVAVTAFEAKNRDHLRQPSRWISWVMTAIYLFVAIAGAFAVNWRNQHLPELAPNPTDADMKSVLAQVPHEKPKCQDYFPLIVIAAYQYGSKGAALYFNACIVYFCVSAANTALYVASRTLYGLFREEGTPRDFSTLSWTQFFVQLPWLLGRVSLRRQVPTWSLLASAAAFLWLIGLRATSGNSATEVSIMLSPQEHHRSQPNRPSR